MDVVGFTFETPPGCLYPSVEVTVNGRNLALVIGDVELPQAAAEGSAELAGSYVGYAPHQLGLGATTHFAGGTGSDLGCGPEDKTALLDCPACGGPGCWTLMARITVTDQTVVWDEFEQVHRKWNYERTSFTFDRMQYESALAALH